MLDKSKLKTGINCITKVPMQIMDPIVRKALDKPENELKIFQTQDIETLKSLYYESIGTL
jgi:hypothetical protein